MKNTMLVEQRRPVVYFIDIPMDSISWWHPWMDRVKT